MDVDYLLSCLFERGSCLHASLCGLAHLEISCLEFASMQVLPRHICLDVCFDVAYMQVWLHVALPSFKKQVAGMHCQYILGLLVWTSPALLIYGQDHTLLCKPGALVVAAICAWGSGPI